MLFRRQAAWTVSRDAGLFRGGFDAFLDRNGATGGDMFVPTARFLAGEAMGRRESLGDHVRRQRLGLPPEGFVFHEAPSGLLDARGAAVTEW